MEINPDLNGDDMLWRFVLSRHERHEHNDYETARVETHDFGEHLVTTLTMNQAHKLRSMLGNPEHEFQDRLEEEYGDLGSLYLIIASHRYDFRVEVVTSCLTEPQAQQTKAELQHDIDYDRLDWEIEIEKVPLRTDDATEAASDDMTTIAIDKRRHEPK